jgi:hypothetical protein
MSGTRPASMNSEVPMANTARASRYTGRGMTGLQTARDRVRISWSPGQLET